MNSPKALTTCRVALLSAAFLLATGTIRSEAVHSADRVEPYRILHVMSYHGSWQWNIDQYRGFRDALKDLPVEYEVMEMDTKRRSTPQAIEDSAGAAQAMIEAWQPDLLYTNDDHAQQHVASRYAGDELPIVFSGVNAEPANYGFTGDNNVTGIREVEHSLQTIRLLQGIVPDVSKIALIVDEGPTWPGTVERVRQNLASAPDIELMAVHTISTFEEYKHVVEHYQGKIDALGILGVFTFTDAYGDKVAYEDVLRWTAENSMIPDFSFWGDRIELGTLVAMRVSGYEQGLAAGRQARAILLDGKHPSELPMEATMRGDPTISLARARALGLKVPSSLLLNSDVKTSYRWEHVQAER